MLAEESVVCPLLIGREAPLTAGLHALQRARTGHGGTLVVSGEAGIGKSRFVRTLAEHAKSDRFFTLQGACFEADRAQPYAPLLDLVRALASATSPALAAHAFAPAATELVTLFPELCSTFTDAAPRAAVDPEEDRRRLFHSFTEALQALGRVQPVLLVIEDVHWSDDATLDLLLHLARRIANEPIALMLTFRSDEAGPRLSRLLADFDRARCASEVGLRPLASTQVSEMLQSIFGAPAAFVPVFVDTLHQLTEGNPFFIEEMLKALLVEGDLVRAGSGWQVKPLEHVRVPRTATEAVDRRLASLSAEAARVASIAAVAGRRFDFALLQAVTAFDETKLLSLVKELLGAQLVVEESADQFAFRHALTREAIRARLLARERLPLHRAIARALEARHAGASHEGDEALAYHTFEAGEWNEARHYALRAAARAVALSAPREAVEQYDRAVTATERAGEHVDPAMMLDRGRALETLGKFQEAHDDFSAGLAAARASGDRRAEWLALHALGMLWAARDYAQAGNHRREALTLARSIGEAPLVAQSLNRVGNWFVNREDPRTAIPYHEEALAIFEQNHDQHGVAETVDLLAMAHHVAGMEAIAMPLYQRSIALFAALENQRALSTALAGIVVCGPSHHASVVPVASSTEMEALLTSERAAQLAGAIGWRAGEAYGRWILADCVAWRGDIARARRLAREALAIASEIDHFEWQCAARRVLGFIALDLFQPAEAGSELEVAHQIARRLGSAIWIRWTGGPLAIARARCGRVAEARALLEEIDEMFPVNAGERRPSIGARQTLGERFLALADAECALASGEPEEVLHLIGDDEVRDTPRTGLLRAEALMALSRGDTAMATLAVARSAAERQGARLLLWRIEAVAGAVHRQNRRRVEARAAFDLARSIAAEIAAGIDDEAASAAFMRGVDQLAPPLPARTAAQQAKAEHGGLTRRERDTAALIAQGLPNRAIARTLGIGERTVEGYVASTLAKLRFSSRSQIAVWAAEQGLKSPESPRHS